MLGACTGRLWDSCWEASRYITTGTQAVWWSNTEAMVNPGVGGNEKAWIEVRLGLALKEN